jgi:predicted nucleotidyltransferase
MTFYQELLQSLEKNHVRYLVVGGVAVVLHGFLRATADLDLLIALDSKNVEAFIKLMKQRGYRPKAPVCLDDFRSEEKRLSWKNEKNMRVFSLIHPQHHEELIDIFIEEPISFEEVYARRVLIPLGKFKASVASSEDLITLKQKAGRSQDLQDIEALKDLQLNNE